jgi:hypothetical protein
MVAQYSTMKISLSLTSLLAVILITLKLAGHITWSWYVVLAPLWLGAAVCCAAWIGLMALIFAAGLHHEDPQRDGTEV